jgi:cysteine desulfurase/selenocysteine lyase
MDGARTPDDVRAALDPRVRMVSLSAVSYGAGERLDLAGVAALCRERGILFVVDGIQAIGALELDMARDGMDCIAADGHKWLCAPEGAGFLAVSDRLLGRLRPVQLGWKSVTNADSYHPYDLSLRRDAAKLEAGSLGLLGLHALGAAVDLALEVGVAAIEARLAELVALFEEGFARRGLALLGRAPGAPPVRRSGIVNFVPGRAPERVRQDLWARGVASTVRFGGIRLSPHHYQDQRDVESFFARLDDAEASAA